MTTAQWPQKHGFAYLNLIASSGATITNSNAINGNSSSPVIEEYPAELFPFSHYYSKNMKNKIHNSFEFGISILCLAVHSVTPTQPWESSEIDEIGVFQVL